MTQYRIQASIDGERWLDFAVTNDLFLALAWVLTARAHSAYFQWQVQVEIAL